VLRRNQRHAVYLRDVATVQIGGDFRRGTLDVNGQKWSAASWSCARARTPATSICAREGEDRPDTPSLPPGVSLKPFYDRSELIDRTIEHPSSTRSGRRSFSSRWRTLFFPLALRSILIVTLPLPVSILVRSCDEAVRHHFEHHVPVRDRIAIGVLVDAAM
jgi:Cu(I)/Ag(I) efflux system membrane protein CusA/SilA